MTAARFDSKEALDARWGGARAAVAVPVRGQPDRATDDVTSATSERTAARTKWVLVALRTVRRAAIGVVLLAAIPIGLVANRRAMFIPNMANLLEKTSEADRWRAFRAPVDASVTPQAAGDALRRITTTRSRDDYPMRAERATYARPWNSITLAPDMFSGMRTAQYSGPAASKLIAKSADGFSDSELAYLRTIAEAPLWKDFDAVALAAQVDIIGGLYNTPFDAKMPLFAFRTVGFADTKQIAYAAVSRAAYYLASGKPEEAERVLRTIVSFGFTFIDQGVSALDAMVGRIIVDIGRDGLHQLYRQTRRSDLAVQLEPIVRASTSAQIRPTAFDEVSARAAAVSLIADVAAPRSLRIEALEMLSFSGSCGSVRAMLTGPSVELRGALSHARASMARYPSEQAFFGLIERTLENGPRVTRDAGVVGRVASGTASVLSAVTGNARLTTCTNLASTIRTRE